MRVNTLYFDRLVRSFKTKVDCPHLVMLTWQALFTLYILIVCTGLLGASNYLDAYDKNFVTFLIALLGSAASLWTVFPSRKILLLIYTLWVILFAYFPYYKSSETSVFGWIIIALLFRGYCAFKKKFFIEEWLWQVMWLVMAMIYFNSGWSKLFDSGWHGSTLETILNSNLSVFSAYGKIIPNEAYRILSLALILLQISSVLMLLPFLTLRRFFWFAHLFFHFMILIALKVDQVSIVFIIFHLILYRREFCFRNYRRD